MVNETTDLGAAYLVVGFWASQEDISNYWLLDTKFNPSMEQQE